MFHRAQNLPEAVVHYAEALRRNPNAAECHSNMGHVMRDLQKLQVAGGICPCLVSCAC